MKLHSAAGAALLVTIMMAGTLPAQGTQSEPPWWPAEVRDSKDLRDGFNLRVPLRVSHPSEAMPKGTPVQVHLDLGREAVKAGWIRDGDQPASFTLDPESIRLLRYNTQWSSIREEEPVPVSVHFDWLEPDQTQTYGIKQSNPFHPGTDPVVTLEWRLESDVPRLQSAYYFVYFDLVENCEDRICQRPAEVPSAEQQAALDAMYWVGRGTRLFGHHPGSSNLSPTLFVIGTEDDTSVEVFAYNGASRFPSRSKSMDDMNTLANPFNLNHGQVNAWTLGTGTLHFMIESDKPVIALTQGGLGSGEFIPSSRGDLAGSHFFIPPGPGAIHIIAPRMPDDDDNTAIAFTTTNLNDRSSCNGQLRPAQQQFWCVMTRQNAAAVAEVAVSDDRPVLVQHDPPAGATTWSQTPSIHGSPTGQEFLAVTRAGQAGGLSVFAKDATRINVQDCSVFPCRNYANARAMASGEEVRLSGQPMAQQPSSAVWTSPPPTPPLSVDASDEGAIRLLHGARGAATPAQATPFGSPGAREFTVQSPFVIHAFYDGTRVQVDMADVSGTADLAATQAYTVCAESTCQLRVPDGTSGAVQAPAACAQAACKPIAVAPMGNTADYRRYLSAQPQFATPSIEPGSYRGHLIDVRPVNGQSPVLVEGLPKQTVSVPFIVQNLGKWDGEALVDTIKLEAKATGPVDSPSFPSDEIVLETGAPFATRVDIPVQEGAAENSQATVNVEGRSLGNENMVRGFSVVVFLRQHFGVEMLWSDTGQRSLRQAFTPPSEADVTQDIPITLRNTGTGDDTFQLAIRPTVGWDTGGWAAELLVDDQPVTDVGPIPQGGEVDVTLRVHIPQSEASNVFLDVTATSQGSPTTASTIRLHATISLGSEVEISVDEPLVQAPPGETVRFLATVANTGKAGVSLVFDLADSLPVGWSASIADGLGDHEQGSRFIGPGGKELVPIDVRVPDSAPAQALGSALLIASDDQGGEAASLAFTVEVLHVQDLGLDGPSTAEADPGESRSLTMTITNGGNGPADVDVLAVLPGGWSATLPGNVGVAAGETREVTLWITSPADALAGEVPVQIIAQANGADVSHEVVIDVQPRHDISWLPTQPLLVRPGQDVQFQAVLVNQGNTPQTVSVAASDSLGSGPVATPDSLEIPRGATRVVTIAWKVPWNAEGEAELALAATSPAGTTSADVPVTITAPTLVLEQLIQPERPPIEGEVAYVTALLHNPTATAAKSVEARLVEDERLLDSVRFDSVGPNGTVMAPLRWVGEATPGQARLAWGFQGDDGFVEIGGQDLGASQAEPVDDARIPAPAVPILLLGLALGLSLAKRGGRS